MRLDQPVAEQVETQVDVVRVSGGVEGGDDRADRDHLDAAAASGPSSAATPQPSSSTASAADSRSVPGEAGSTS